MRLQYPGAAFQRNACFVQDIRRSASKNVINISGDGANCLDTPPNTKVQTRVERRGLDLQARATWRVHGVRQMSLQGAMKFRRRIIQAVCRQPEIGRPMSRISLKFGPAPVSATGRFSGPVCARNRRLNARSGLRETRRKERLGPPYEFLAGFRNPTGTGKSYEFSRCGRPPAGLPPPAGPALALKGVLRRGKPKAGGRG